MENLTAVDWLLKQIDDMYIHQIYDKQFNQAKEMEKQQIIDAYQNGGIDGQVFALTRKINIENGEQYYNQTFKN
jgi:hypothetical protein